MKKIYCPCLNYQIWLPNKRSNTWLEKKTGKCCPYVVFHSLNLHGL